MGTEHHVALLRGINVGGRNKITMADLRAAFEAGGYRGVATYIQSGNVLLESRAGSAPQEDDIEELLAERFGTTITVVVRSHAELRRVVTGSPEGFGETPDTHHCDVVFLKAPVTPERAMQVLDPRPGVDRAWAGAGVLYVERLRARRGESRLSRVVGTAEYRSMTIRNWNTTTRLLSLLDERSTG
jgi:uncharacterized protein (DUF1697 family)